MVKIVTSCIIGSLLLGLLLTKIPGQKLAFLDSSSNIINLCGIILMNLRFKECWIIWLFNNVFDLVIWIINATKNTPNSQMMLIVSIGYLLIFIIKEVAIEYFATFEFDYDFDNVKITKSFLNLEVKTKYENLTVNDIIQGIKYVLNKSDIKSNNLYINNELKNENLKKCKIIKKYIADGKKYFFNY